MTPQEQRLMGEMLREALKSGLEPITKQIEGVVKDIGVLKTDARDAKREIVLLKETDRKHSGVHREVKASTQEVRAELPKMQSLTEEQIAREIAREKEQREKELDATTTAYERMLRLHDDLSTRLESSNEVQRSMAEELRQLKTAAIIQHQNQALSLVTVPDGQGGEIVKAASTVAVGKIDAVGVDTTNTKKETAKILKWQKAIAPLVVAVPVVAEVVRQILAAHGK